MHKPVFSSIAGTILRVSDVVLEDDSGMPYRLFDHSVWEISLHGAYGGPIELFKDYYQKDLLDAYAAGAGPLGFHIGYGKKSNLLLAVRKNVLTPFRIRFPTSFFTWPRPRAWAARRPGCGSSGPR